MTTVLKELGGYGEPRREAVLAEIITALDENTELTLDEVLHNNNPHLEPVEIAELIFTERVACPKVSKDFWDYAFVTAIELIEERPLDEHETEELETLKERYRYTCEFDAMAVAFEADANSTTTQNPNDIDNDVYQPAMPMVEVDFELATNITLQNAVETWNDKEINRDPRYALQVVADVLESYRETFSELDPNGAENEEKHTRLKRMVFALAVKKITEIAQSHASEDVLFYSIDIIDKYSPSLVDQVKARGHFDKYILPCVANLPKEEQCEIVEQYASTVGRRDELLAQITE